MKLSKKDFLSIANFNREELEEVLNVCKKQKPLAKQFKLPESHRGRLLACIFHKPSLRTRVSFEVAMRQLGGSSLYITDREIGIGSREAPKDAARVLSRFVDAIMIRTFDQGLVEEMAKYATVPVINGLTDILHPCQIMGDVFTIIEKLESIDGKKVVFIGDGNNVARSWLNAASKFNFKFVLSSPAEYRLDDEYVEKLKQSQNLDYEWIEDPFEAVKDADVIYTDVWASMGQEDEKEKRKNDFKGYQVNEKLMEATGKNTLFMHCLPAHRGEEVTDSVIDSENSVVIDQAENRLHIQRAILYLLVPGEEE